jgi:hypothetical protein
MLKIVKNCEHFVICGPLAKFLLLKLILRPAQQFDFDMSALNHHYFFTPLEPNPIKIES